MRSRGLFRRISSCAHSRRSRGVNAITLRHYANVSARDGGTAVEASDGSEESIRELTAEAKRLIVARRHGDAERIIDEGLGIFPWQSPLWFWKLAASHGNARNALQIWDNMTRLGVKKLAAHYDMMANIIHFSDSRHVMLDLYKEQRRNKILGNPKFYICLFRACSAGGRTRHLKVQAHEIWLEMKRTPDLVHLTEDVDVRAAYEVLSPIQTTLGLARDTAVDGIGSAPQVEPRGNVDPQAQLIQSVDSITEQASEPQIQGSFTGSPPENACLDQSNVSSSDQAFNRRLRTTLEPFLALDFVGHDFEKIHAAQTKSLQSARHLLQQNQGQVDIRSYNYTIRNAARSQTPQVLLELVEEAIDQGLQPDVKTYTPIITSLFRHNMVDKALEQIDRMEVTNVRFDIHIVTRILKGLLDNKRDDVAISFFVDILQGKSDLILDMEHDGERNCFRTLIEGLASRGRMEDAQKLLSIMLFRNVDPDLGIYVALVRGMFGRGNVVEAMKYYNLAVMTPDLHRVNMHWKAEMDELAAVVVSGCLNSHHYEEAQAFLNDAAQHNRWHSTTSKPFCTFIRWLGGQDRIDEAWSLFEFHRSRFDEYQTYKLYRTVLRALFIHRRDLEGAVQWLQTMETVCEIADQGPYYDLVEFALAKDEMEIASQVWSNLVLYLRRTGQVMSRELSQLGKQAGLHSVHDMAAAAAA